MNNKRIGTITQWVGYILLWVGLGMGFAAVQVGLWANTDIGKSLGGSAASTVVLGIILAAVGYNVKEYGGK